MVRIPNELIPLVEEMKSLVNQGKRDQVITEVSRHLGAIAQGKLYGMAELMSSLGIKQEIEVKISHHSLAGGTLTLGDGSTVRWRDGEPVRIDKTRLAALRGEIDRQNRQSFSGLYTLEVVS